MHVHLLCRRRLRKSRFYFHRGPFRRAAGELFHFGPQRLQIAFRICKRCSNAIGCALQVVGCGDNFLIHRGKLCFQHFYTGGNIICRACHHIAHLRFFAVGARHNQFRLFVRLLHPHRSFRVCVLQKLLGVRFGLFQSLLRLCVGFLSQFSRTNLRRYHFFLGAPAFLVGTGALLGKRISHLLQLGCHAIVGSQQFIPLFLKGRQAFFGFLQLCMQRMNLFPRAEQFSTESLGFCLCHVHTARLFIPRDSQGIFPCRALTQHILRA